MDYAKLVRPEGPEEMDLAKAIVMCLDGSSISTSKTIHILDAIAALKSGATGHMRGVFLSCVRSDIVPELQSVSFMECVVDGLPQWANIELNSMRERMARSLGDTLQSVLSMQTAEMSSQSTT